MARSFGIVEDKLFEAEFFLERLGASDRFKPEAKYYFSAFVSAARSVTFALQESMSGIDGFDLWYESARSKLKTDLLARYFVEVRNEAIHKGLNPLNQITLDLIREDLSRQLNQNDHSHVLVLPDMNSQGPSLLVDAVQVSTQYFVSLVDVIFECYDQFRHVVDPRWYLTFENFAARGKTFEDAVTELGFPREWALCAPSGDDGWRAIRSQQPLCPLNDMFRRYIDREIPDPDETSRDL